MSDRLVIVSSSTSLPLSRLEAKAWLKIEEEETADDAVIDQLIATAWRRYELLTQVAPMEQTYDVYRDTAPCGALVVPRNPVASVVSIRTFSSTELTDTGGSVMAASDYYLDVASDLARVVPMGGATWPSGSRSINGFVARIVAGHSAETTCVPDAIKTTLCRMVARAYEFRGDQSQAEQDALMDEVVADELAVQEWG